MADSWKAGTFLNDAAMEETHGRLSRITGEDKYDADPDDFSLNEMNAGSGLKLFRHPA
jgi:hypothetical protein